VKTKSNNVAKIVGMVFKKLCSIIQLDELLFSQKKPVRSAFPVTVPAQSPLILDAK